jgi:hypothetical protein
VFFEFIDIGSKLYLAVAMGAGKMASTVGMIVLDGPATEEKTRLADIAYPKAAVMPP